MDSQFIYRNATGLGVIQMPRPIDEGPAKKDDVYNPDSNGGAITTTVSDPEPEPVSQPTQDSGGGSTDIDYPVLYPTPIDENGDDPVTGDDPITGDEDESGYNDSPERTGSGGGEESGYTDEENDSGLPILITDPVTDDSNDDTGNGNGSGQNNGSTATPVHPWEQVYERFKRPLLITGGTVGTILILKGLLK